MATMQEMIDRVPAHERQYVQELARDVLFMKRKLAETRKGIAKQQVVIPYDNGGGQTGIRENPAFKGYESLLKSYTAALRELRAALESASKADDSKGSESPLMRILGEAKAS